ncbi:hypothetical protein DFH08DRAFT_321655 [Mycena albidolilacea]|uniref:DUF6533 domain-containing protein n=1 Tax=Mycena albidolilacea TaxID=1033008 RepID=A0AAD7AMK0_9AGAR|nr:hypothetical protein DFH08DRAFT_321655 [Mycena albidolilacea]
MPTACCNTIILMFNVLIALTLRLYPHNHLNDGKVPAAGPLSLPSSSRFSLSVMSNVTAEVAFQIRIHDCLHLLGICVLYYDHLLTLDTEIDYMWKGLGAAYWFYIIRCHIYHIGHQVLLVGTQIIVSIVMTLRTHALYGRNLRLFAALLAVGLPLLGIVVWSTQGQQATPIDDFPGCHVSISQSTAYHLVASWEALFVYDTLLFLLVLRRTYTTWRDAAFKTNLPIHALLLRDGVLYFGAIAFVNFCNIATFYFAGPILAGSLSTFTSCMSVTITARLMLNLHANNKRGYLTDLDCLSREESNVVFAQNPWPINPNSRLGGLDLEMQRTAIPASP